jgi:hypothetical protein
MRPDTTSMTHAGVPSPTGDCSLGMKTRTVGRGSRLPPGLGARQTRMAVSIRRCGNLQSHRRCYPGASPDFRARCGAIDARPEQLVQRQIRIDVGGTEWTSTRMDHELPICTRTIEPRSVAEAFNWFDPSKSGSAGDCCRNTTQSAARAGGRRQSWTAFRGCLNSSEGESQEEARGLPPEPSEYFKRCS